MTREAQMIADARSGEPVTEKTELGFACQAPVERALDGKLYVFLGYGDKGQAEWFLIDLDTPKDDEMQAKCLRAIERGWLPPT